jgi:hypothetical protein
LADETKEVTTMLKGYVLLRFENLNPARGEDHMGCFVRFATLAECEAAYGSAWTGGVPARMFKMTRAGGLEHVPGDRSRDEEFDSVSSGYIERIRSGLTLS